jgi:hypothetical protein
MRGNDIPLSSGKKVETIKRSQEESAVYIRRD